MAEKANSFTNQTKDKSPRAKKIFNNIKRRAGGAKTPEPAGSVENIELEKDSPQVPPVGKIPDNAAKAEPGSHNAQDYQPVPKTDRVGEKQNVASGNESNAQDDPEKDLTLGSEKVNNKQDRNTNQASTRESNSAAAIPKPQRDLWKEAWMSAELNSQRTRLEQQWEDEHLDLPDEISKNSNGPKKPKSPKNHKCTTDPEDLENLGDPKGAKKPEELVEVVIVRTKEKLADYQKRWGSETESTAAGRARSIMLSALAVKDLIAAPLMFDPSGYGSSAWKVVTFGLELVQNDKVRMDRTFEASEYLATLLARYARIETHYQGLRLEDALQKRLEDAIINVYIAVLKYSAEVRKSLECSALCRIKENFRALAGQPLETLKGSATKEDKTVKQWQEQIDREYEARTGQKVTEIKETVENIMNDLTKLGEDVLETKESVFAQESHDVLEWLFSTGKDPSLEKHKKLRTAIESSESEAHKAGDWLMKLKEYQTWEEQPQSLLWLHGPSGCGKSSLCSTIIKRLGELCDKTNSKKLLMRWYFRFDEERTMDLTLLLRSFLRQLGSGGFPEEIRLWLRKKIQGYGEPDFETLIEKLYFMINGLDKDVFIVLDGLDEVSQHATEAKRSNVLILISKLAKKSYPNLHILLVSKDEGDIRASLEKDLAEILVKVDVKSGLQKDLEKFIETTMEQDENLGELTLLTKKEIRSRLNEGEEKSFLWVTSLLDELRNCLRDPQKITDTLKKVPDNMVTRYQSALQDVHASHEASLKSILIWLLRQLRPVPLTRDEIAMAVGIDAASVTQICTGALVTTSKRTLRTPSGYRDVEVLGFVHFSAQEYLESALQRSHDLKISRFHFSDAEAHLQITKRCLAVFLPATDNDNEQTEAQRGSALLQYAAQYWFKQYQLIDRKKISEDEATQLDQDVCKLFRTNSAAFASWLDCFDPDSGFVPSEEFDMEDGGGKGERTRADPLYYAVKLELVTVAELLIEADGPHARGGREGSVLQLALYKKNARVVDALLSRGADVKAKGGPHGTALYVASAQGDKTTVRRLLDAGAKADGAEDGKFGSALHAAAYYGHAGVVDELLRTGQTQADQLGGMFGTALQAASAAAQLRVVELLLSHQAGPNVVGGLLGTALQAALNNTKSTEIVKTLRQAGAEYQDSHDVDWTSAFWRFNKESRQKYTDLFQPPQQQTTKTLSEPQRLLAAAIVKWQLPGILLCLDRCRHKLSRTFGYKIPFEVQLEEILRVAPKLETNIQELSRRGFLHKALFWGGINHIFEGLGPLVSRGALEIEDAFASRGPWRVSRDRFGLHSRWLETEEDLSRMDLSRMDLSDQLAIDLFEQRQLRGEDREEPRQRQETCWNKEGASQRSWLRLGGIARWEGRLPERVPSDDVPRHIVISDLLSLVRGLVQFANQCDRYHDVVHEQEKAVSQSTQKAIKDLTFELFAAVIRLAVSMESQTFKRLQRTVRLLTTVRLRRISDLNSMCEKQLAEIEVPESRTRDISTEIANQLKGVLAEQADKIRSDVSRQLEELQLTLLSDVKTDVSALVAQETSSALAQFQVVLQDNIQQELQRQLDRAETASLPDKKPYARNGWFFSRWV